MKGNNEKIIQQTQEYLENEKRQPTTIKDAENALELFISIQRSVNDKEKQAELYKDKNYFAVEFENKFEGGDSKQGKQTFNQLTSSVTSHHKGFNFYQQNPQKLVSHTMPPNDPSERPPLTARSSRV